MATRIATATIARKRAIPSWRFMAGVFLHFAVPAYVVAVPAICLFTATAGAGFADLLHAAPRASAWFLGGYTALATIAAVAAALFDPVARWRRRRAEARDPRVAALASDRRVALAIADGRRLLDDRSGALLDAMRRTRWDHADERFQALSSDLAEIVRTSSAAIASATAERRPALREMAVESLERIDGALTRLVEERARLDEGDAVTIARYVRLRHMQSDFSGDGS